jgi:ABC-type protease/lipase transport system fused ATPase/permease subunit
LGLRVCSGHLHLSFSLSLTLSHRLNKKQEKTKMAELLGLGSLGAVGTPVAAAGASVATAVFVGQMLQSVGQSLERWKKKYRPEHIEQISTIKNA